MRTVAVTKAGWAVRPEMGKFSTARAVWAPHSASSGTRTSPMVSCSPRVRLVFLVAMGRSLAPKRGPRRRP